MAIKMVSLKCPNCNSNVMVEKGRKSCFCTYCGAQLFLDDGSVNININHNHNYTYRSIDETGIRKAELEADLAKRRLNKEEREDRRRNFGTTFWAAVLIFCCLVLPLAWLLFPSDAEKAHKKQVAEFEQLVQEIEVDIENKDYDSARIKDNKIHYTANWSDDAKERWDAVREDTLALIDELQYGIKTEKKEKEKGFFDSIFGLFTLEVFNRFNKFALKFCIV